MDNIYSLNINRRTVWTVIATFAVSAAALCSCVKDDLYDTTHPHHGKITVSADWTGRGDGVPEPERWVLNVGDYSAEVAEKTHDAERLFNPGEYRMITYTPVAGVTVAGTTVTVSAESGARGNASIIIGNPGWFFADVQDITIGKDCRHLFTAAMRQTVKSLTLIVEPTGNMASAIERFAGRLAGVAGTLDFASGTYGAPSDVRLDFTKVTEGADAGKWKATVRLLGITGERQWFSATVTFAGGNPQPLTIESDLSAVLADFNTDKTIPFALGGSIVETPGEAGITATIGSWEEVNGGNVDAH